MNQTVVANKLYHFREKNYISFSDMVDIIKTKYQTVKIYTTKLSGSNMVRDMYTTNKVGRPLYNYAAKGYWVLWDEGSSGYRTVVLKNIEKISVDDQTYYVE